VNGLNQFQNDIPQILEVGNDFILRFLFRVDSKVRIQLLEQKCNDRHEVLLRRTQQLLGGNRCLKQTIIDQFELHMTQADRNPHTLIVAVVSQKDQQIANTALRERLVDLARVFLELADAVLARGARAADTNIIK
jgi:hypothetical protein